MDTHTDPKTAVDDDELFEAYLLPTPPRAEGERAEDERSVRISVVVPVYDEEGNLRPLYDAVRAALDGCGPWQLVLVNDCSADGSGAALDALAAEDPRVTALHHARRRGQSFALATGFARAAGRLVATLDADLQNDPADLPAMAERLEAAGLDGVVGVRAKRQDTWVRRTSSRIARAVRHRLTGDHATDTGCATRVLRAEAVAELPVFNGMHRFIPALLELRGRRYEEVPVRHHERTRGVSKYGIGNRAFRALADALAVRWMRSRQLGRVEQPGDVLGPGGVPLPPVVRALRVDVNAPARSREG